MNRIKKIVLLLVVFALMCTPVCIYAQDAKAKENTNIKGSISTDDFDISVVCGIRGQCKYNYAIPVNIDIESKNADFSGTVRMIVPGSSNRGTEAIAYEKEVILSKNNKKHITMSVYSEGIVKKFTFQLENEKGKILVEQPVKIGSRSNQNALVGVLSDDYTALNYFDDKQISNGYYDGKSQLVELKADNIPEQSSGIEMLSYLIINSYDTSKLTEQQLIAIKEWVRQGGTLILGGGNDYKQTLSGFADVISIKGAKNDAGSFGVNKANTDKAVKKVLFGENEGLFQLDIEQSENIKGVISTDGLIKRCTLNKGNIVLTAFNLGMEPIVSWVDNAVFAQNLYNKAATGYSAQRIANVGYDGIQDIYSTSNVLDSVMDNKYPHVTAITIILVIFVLFGPVIYFVLKKLDKRELLWIIIPISSVCFTVLLFVVNADIRIRYPVSKSVTIISEEDNDGEKVVSTSATVGIMVPGTGKTEVKTNSGMDNLHVFNSNGEYYDSDSTVSDWNDNYTSSVKECSDGYNLGYKNSSTFQTKYVNFNYTGKTDVLDGLKTEYKRSVTGISGKVTNESGYDLKQVCVISYGKAILLGDMKKGQTAEFDENQNSSFLDMDFYNLKYPKIEQDGKTFYTIAATYSMATQYNSNFSEQGTEIYTLGYIDGYNCDYIADENVKEYNRGVYIKKEQVGYSDYEDAEIINLFSCAAPNDKWDMNDGQLYDTTVEAEFNLDEDVENVYALIRSKDSERRYGQTKNTKIYAWNYEKEAYEEIFKDEIIMKFKDGCPYLDEYGVMKLKFEAQKPSEDYAPFITVVGGEK